MLLGKEGKVMAAYHRVYDVTYGLSSNRDQLRSRSPALDLRVRDVPLPLPTIN